MLEADRTLIPCPMGKSVKRGMWRVSGEDCEICHVKDGTSRGNVTYHRRTVRFEKNRLSEVP
jgi:hypothetical protein